MATEFQKAVWEVLKKIPKGRVTTYSEIAKAIGKERAQRAVGSAVGKNPFAPDVPCHRVIPSSGKIGRYSAEGGVKRKIELLQAEGVDIKDGKVQSLDTYLYYFK